jgi:DHA1 family bicyclomycin/chloramphenicol resistance-like MFS transporter
VSTAASSSLLSRRSWTLATLLASLSMLGPFSIDLYLPAFPAIGSDLGVPALAVQQTLSIYLFTYAGMMLWHGALTDALGRRPVVLAGLAVYALATLGCAIAGNIESLWLFRALQGLSAGTGMVVGRAVIRDRFQGAEAQRLMAQITLVFGIAPAIAPIVGGVLLNAFGWRAIFWALLAWVLATLAWTARSLTETLPKEQRQPLNPGTQWRNYKAVLTRPEFLLLAFVPAFNFAGFFIYVAGAPAFLVDHLGLTTMGFGALFVPLITGVLVGATISGRVAGRWSHARAIGVGYAFMFGAALCNLAICAFAPPGVVWNIAPVLFFTLGSSIVMPNVTLLLLDLFPRTRGLVSSLQGFVQFTLAGFVAGSVAPAIDRSLLGLALGMAAFTLAGYALWLAYLRRIRAAN